MKRFRIFTSFTVLLVLVAVSISSCAGLSSAKITSPALVSYVKIYDPDYESNGEKWLLQTEEKYEYEKAYPVKVEKRDGDMTSTTDFEYEFDGERPVKAKYKTSGDDGSYEISYTKKGLVNRSIGYDNTGRKVSEKIFQYGNRDEYFTLVLHENIISPPEEKVVDHMEEVDSIIITTENGLLKKTVNDGLFANHNDNEEKKWLRFDGSYTVNYDDNGIAEETTAIFSTFPGSGKQYKFELTVSDGRVTEALRYLWQAASNEDGSESSSEDGEWVPDRKYEFEYSDTEISASRYASMINYFLLEGGITYYIYNWY